ncbi:tungstate ABC transporter substrate-binding protein WtpA [Lebetimonas sp. JS032]|uniref:tungstate ABC transporter substrate-binding protein WtpA n=1 Tax=Lebetimonas sp. JS032 TaxID=990070 RepID=UPI0004635EBE|nr:tungstate ABC transporter substrate-binding protein WtpA [Lebetimonas sp. JS032]
MKKFALIFSVIVLFAFGKKIVVFHAGSLSVPFSQIEQKFEEKYPQYDVVREAAGSRACARKITDLHKKADVMASADYKVIDNLLRPKYAKFNALFATNEMIIAYTPHSKYADKINSNNWMDILLKPGVKVGHSNPNLDPCGYRTMLVAKLAGMYYNRPEFFNKLFGYGDSYENGEENRNKVVVRPKETDLLGLLEAGAFDYLFIYKSVAMQHHLKFITLPPQINLGDKKYANFYKKASFKVTGKKPGTYIVKKGAPMVYGITVVENKKEGLPPHEKGAVLFVKYVLSPKGQAIMKKNGQGVINPPIIEGDDSILKNY